MTVPRTGLTRAAAVVTALLMLYSFARIIVQFLEALSVVRAQRGEDVELLEICRRGEARSSAKLRQACMNAHADLASPLVFKAVLHAVGTAFAEFCETVGSPTKLAMLVFFCIGSVAMPILPWARWLCSTDITPAPLQGVHYVSYVSDGLEQVPRNSSLRSRWKGAVNRLRALPDQSTLGWNGSADPTGDGFADVELRACTLPHDDVESDGDDDSAAWLHRVFSKRSHSKWD